MFEKRKKIKKTKKEQQVHAERMTTAKYLLMCKSFTDIAETVNSGKK